MGPAILRRGVWAVCWGCIYASAWHPVASDLVKSFPNNAWSHLVRLLYFGDSNIELLLVMTSHLLRWHWVWLVFRLHRPTSLRHYCGPRKISRWVVVCSRMICEPSTLISGCIVISEWSRVDLRTFRCERLIYQFRKIDVVIGSNILSQVGTEVFSSGGRNGRTATINFSRLLASLNYL